MKAMVLHGGADLRRETVPDPAPAPNEAVVEVRACSICGSDLHAYHGKHPRLTFPRVLGHEFAGEIVALGARSGTSVSGTASAAISISRAGSAGPAAKAAATSASG